jgi:glycosyltransferase involved in cell wall biosynthesis
MRTKKLLVIGALIGVVCCGTYLYQSYFSIPDLTIIGAVEMKDGLGKHCAECIEALHKDAVIGFMPTTTPSFKGVSKTAKQIIKNHLRPFGRVILFFDCVWTPNKDNYKILKTKKSKDQIRLAYSMVESSQIPNEWVKILNEYFDAVIVPDNYYIKVYEQSGVLIPVFSVSLGVNLKPFLRQELKVKPHHPFVFGNFGAGVARKNQKLLVEAFHEAFGSNPNIILKINCRYVHPEVEQDIRQYLHEHGIRNIFFSKNALDQELYIEEFQSLDCLVYISKGEGFSIQPREAMALGIPVILSDNTAHKTICKTGLARKIPSCIQEPAWNTWGTILKKPIQYGYQYNCHKEDVVEALVDMYTHYDTYLKQAPDMKKWVQQYDFSELRSLYLSFVKPQSVTLSTKNKITPQGVFTNSRELFEKFKTIEQKKKGS